VRISIGSTAGSESPPYPRQVNELKRETRKDDAGRAVIAIAAVRVRGREVGGP
jgi:hypothetical protein